jgi:hypothetical protein
MWLGSTAGLVSICVEIMLTITWHCRLQVLCDSLGAGGRFGNNYVDPVSHVFLWLFINIMTNLSQYIMIMNYYFLNVKSYFLPEVI